MHKALLYSRILQFSIVLSFLLPFFTVGCGGRISDETAAAVDSTAADTTAIVPSDTLADSLHTLVKDTLNKSNPDTAHVASSAIEKKSDDKKSKFLSVELAKEYPWSKRFLYSEVNDPTFDGQSFTGVALIINNLEYFVFECISFALLIIILCLLIKFLDPLALRTQLLLNVLAILFLSLYIPPGWHQRSEIGFHLCITLLVLTAALDIYRLLKSKKQSV